MSKQNVSGPRVRWDDESDPSCPGWVVLTRTSGWQPPRGGLDCSPMLAGGSRRAREVGARTLARMARSVVRYHDGARGEVTP